MVDLEEHLPLAALLIVGGNNAPLHPVARHEPGSDQMDRCTSD